MGWKCCTPTCLYKCEAFWEKLALVIVFPALMCHTSVQLSMPSLSCPQSFITACIVHYHDFAIRAAVWMYSEITITHMADSVSYNALWKKVYNHWWLITNIHHHALCSCLKADKRSWENDLVTEFIHFTNKLRSVVILDTAPLFVCFAPVFLVCLCVFIPLFVYERAQGQVDEKTRTEL